MNTTEKVVGTLIILTVVLGFTSPLVVLPIARIIMNSCAIGCLVAALILIIWMPSRKHHHSEY